jgi:hypothetical protein
MATNRKVIDPAWLNHLDIKKGELLFDLQMGLVVIVKGFDWEIGKVICLQIEETERFPNWGEEWLCHGSFLRRFTVEGE